MDFVALENAGKKIFEQFPFIKGVVKEYINFQCMLYQKRSLRLMERL